MTRRCNLCLFIAINMVSQIGNCADLSFAFNNFSIIYFFSSNYTSNTLFTVTALPQTANNSFSCIKLPVKKSKISGKSKSTNRQQFTTMKWGRKINGEQLSFFFDDKIHNFCMYAYVQEFLHTWPIKAHKKQA